MADVLGPYWPEAAADRRRGCAVDAAVVRRASQAPPLHMSRPPP